MIELDYGVLSRLSFGLALVQKFSFLRSSLKIILKIAFEKHSQLTFTIIDL